jgi:hypothetical protein
MPRKLLNLAVISAVFIIACQAACLGQDVNQTQEDYIGEFSGWGVKVPRGNYNIIKYTIGIFGTRWGANPQTLEELEERTWDQLLLSYEAFRRDIKVEQKQLEEEITKLFKAENVKFDWKTDKKAYEDWVKEKAKEPVDVFENEMRHQIQLENLRRQLLDSFHPVVTEKEAFKEFLNEYNTLELELVQFDELAKAKEFFKKMKQPSLWKKEAEKDPKFAKHPGFVALEFLREMWKIPEQDLYKMMKLDVDSIYPPTPIYKGWGVFRILKKRAADEAEFDKLRQSYFNQVESIKKYQELDEWLKNLKQEAAIRIYPGDGSQLNLEVSPNVNKGDSSNGK